MSNDANFYRMRNQQKEQHKKAVVNISELISEKLSSNQINELYEFIDTMKFGLHLAMVARINSKKDHSVVSRYNYLEAIHKASNLDKRNLENKRKASDLGDFGLAVLVVLANKDILK